MLYTYTSSFSLKNPKALYKLQVYLIPQVPMEKGSLQQEWVQEAICLDQHTGSPSGRARTRLARSCAVWLKGGNIFPTLLPIPLVDLNPLTDTKEGHGSQTFQFSFV